jgi:hypothetical protein
MMHRLMNILVVIVSQLAQFELICGQVAHARNYLEQRTCSKRNKNLPR